MKGTIFVELIKMAEDAFGEDAVDRVLDSAELENDGAYTTVGNYPCSELVKIVVAFSEHSGIAPEALQKMFGHWMLTHFVAHYPQFFSDKDDAFSLLESIEGEIHVEVRKLYPEAELPTFSTERTAPNQMLMVYESPRPLAAFCHGMIEAALAHFDEDGGITSQESPAEPTITNFEITLQS
ncbi:heme NO-binding domain-containing protein [Celeribacter sp.]|uniref:heme NO-binding domain-containing protein n=1 Tax=Celeribacter sp. TaxID=1890673 RepID=UPI003A8CAAFE